uniref:VP3 n=1 Tax=Rotavirus L TaxID=2682576 RepID=A0A650D7B1_9REOV|nr:VP3 [Rotavirus L]
MSKIIVCNRASGIKVEDDEGIFKISNILQREITINANPSIIDKIRKQTFYTVFDIDNNGDDAKDYEIYSSIYPTPIFTLSDGKHSFGTCRHVLSNVLHYSNRIYDNYIDTMQSYLPMGWKLERIADPDFPIGNDVIPYLFDHLNDLTITKYLSHDSRFSNVAPKCVKDEKTKSEKLDDVLSYIFKPATHYDPQSYNYKVSRQQIGNLVRQASFSHINDRSKTYHIIGPEMESLQLILLKYMEGYNINLYTFSTKVKKKYNDILTYQKKTKLQFKDLLAGQRKNQNLFFRGLLSHVRKFGKPTKIYYIGSYPLFWLEAIAWLEIPIICYDPKYRKVDNPNVIWKEQMFTIEDVDNVENDSYIYIDIRSDYRNSKNRDELLKIEDEFIVDITKRMVKDRMSVLCKRKIFRNNISLGCPIFPPNINFGREYYNYFYMGVESKRYSEDQLFDIMLTDSFENVAQFVYQGEKFDENTAISHKDFIIALYSLSNSLNPLKVIERVIAHDHIVTFPTYFENEDWRNLPNSKEPFPKVVQQLTFSDHSIDPKSYVHRYKVEVVSESVFLQPYNLKAFIPDMYNHMVSFRFKQEMFYSDRFYAHVGIRQPSIFTRDTYLTSRIAAYITRQLTHSVDLSNLQKNHFEGYSGHLIAIEQYFNSLCYTMSPYRWILRARFSLNNKIRDKFRIGKGEPHTKEEFENTYTYLYENSLITDINFQNTLLH